MAQAYAGHQFGGYNPRLGDGRALLLGELAGPDGRLRDLHLKGSGPTPFSRGGDGLAAVGPMLREYVISEAMHALGIPTTRRWRWWRPAGRSTGRPPCPGRCWPGSRAATCGSAASSSPGRPATSTCSAGWPTIAIERHHPGGGRQADNRYLALYEAVVTAQASLVAQWMLVGFIHGVMNTDNITISGETIDYGPCAFMEAVDPATVYSSIDAGGRYAYGNQPLVAEWNLARFAESLLPLLADEQEQAVEMAVEALSGFRPRYGAAWAAGMRAKLGLPEGLDDEVTRRARRRPAGAAAGGPRRPHLVLPGAGRRGPRRRRPGARPLPRPGRLRRLGAAVARPGVRTATRWTGSTPSTSPATTSSRRRSTRRRPATSGRSAGCSTAVTRPFEEREGLERYAAPAPEEFGAAYRTFCGT